jgi:eukaryotic-like serine/threonine-protein kinase
MSLSTGQTLGSYRILARLGSGGMGEVWRAVDTRLEREVALKVLPAGLVGDPERRARFEREAKVLASLNHPHIATLHALEHLDSQYVLVMELVEGSELTELIARGPIPADESIAIAAQIADALEAAHEKGIVHRDLKPANVKVRADGTVKVLDFGLAKAWDDEAPRDDPSHSPTLTHQFTRAGVVLGTAAYMAPEQARGKTVDRRADIWAFGAVLYEMLAGRRAFEGDTVSDTMAAVLTREPDWSALPSATPAPVRRLLRRCLEKDPRRRMRDIGDARPELEDARGVASQDDAPPPGPAAPRRVAWRVVGAAGLAGAALAGLIALALWPRAGAHDRPVRRFEISGGTFNEVANAAISPDGRVVAMRGDTLGGKLLLRSLDDFAARPLGSSPRAVNPFFSPDSRSVAFFGPGGLVRTSISGGALQRVCEAAVYGSGAWGPDGTIVFAGGLVDGVAFQGLMRVAADGGTPQVLTTPDPAPGERRHAWPIFLPDGDTILYTVLLTEGLRIDAVSLATGKRLGTVTAGAHPRYAASGHLLFWDGRETNLLAVRFDPKTRRLDGNAVTVLPNLPSFSDGRLAYDISSEGTLIFGTAQLAMDAFRVVWVDRGGRESPLIDEPASWTQPRLSPDGRQLLLRRSASPNCALWMLDIERRTLSRFTTAGDTHDPIWSPDGRWVVYSLAGTATHGIVRQAADGSGAVELLVESVEHRLLPRAFTPDGKALVVASSDLAANGADLRLLALDGTRALTPLIATPFQEDFPAFSPDGRFLAYTSDQSGRQEVYVRPYPQPGAIEQVSDHGGSAPRWSPDGRELFYAQDDSLMRVAVDTRAGFRAGVPERQLTGNYVWARPNNVDLTRDGTRFVMIRRPGDAMPVPTLKVVLDWWQELNRLVPASGRS